MNVWNYRFSIRLYDFKTLDSFFVFHLFVYYFLVYFLICVNLCNSCFLFLFLICESAVVFFVFHLFVYYLAVYFLTAKGAKVFCHELHELSWILKVYYLLVYFLIRVNLCNSCFLFLFLICESAVVFFVFHLFVYFLAVYFLYFNIH